MIELDYAFLAGYATIQDASLTTVSASFTEIHVNEIPTLLPISIAGRVRISTDIEEVVINLKILPPHDSYELSGSISLTDLTTLPEYGDGKRGAVFASQVNIPLNEPGTYTVIVDLAGTDNIDRVLKFTAIRN